MEWGVEDSCSKNNRNKILKNISEHQMCLRADLPGNFSAKMVYIQTRAVHRYAKLTCERNDFCNVREAQFLHLIVAEELGHLSHTR